MTTRGLIRRAATRPLCALIGLGLLGLLGCSSAGPATNTSGAGASESATSPQEPFVVTPVATLDAPWAMTFLPDNRLLVTEKAGTLLIVDPGTGTTTTVAGAPTVVDDGQGGFGDVIVAPGAHTDTDVTTPTVYLSWVEAGKGGTGAVVGRARLNTSATPKLEDLQVIWRQSPKVRGSGHFGHRLAISPDGRHLFVTSGERQKFDPAQDLDTNLGKIVRLNLDGTAAAVSNPFPFPGGISGEVWSYGHRNPLGIAFDADGNLWSTEMGPKGGDELNLIRSGTNYGWPLVSNGSHYDGRDIPDHAPGDGFEAPKVWWNPSISPSSLMIYSGGGFPQWHGDAFIGALSGESLIRVDLDGTDARKADQWPMAARIREVEQGPDGAIWLLEDGPGGRLLKLTPPG